MKINIKINKEPTYGSKRIVTKFAWLPIIINHPGVTNIVWLSTVTLEQEYVSHSWKNRKVIENDKDLVQ